MRTRWKVGLSNGENFVEGMGEFSFIDGEQTPWQRLGAYIQTNSLKITSLAIEKDGVIYNVPSQGKNPKFRAFALSEKPLDYNFFRVFGTDMNRRGLRIGKPDLYAVVQAIYNNYKLELWVDEQSNSCWTLIK